MKYKAVAKDFMLNGKPLQSFGQDLKRLDDWAQKIVEKHGCVVEIFVTEEKLIITKRPSAKTAHAS